ncbi:MAG TPA: CoA ligase [Chloroflexi bacterium]|nr:CoA ligase [Chloroflexota bacterium]
MPHDGQSRLYDPEIETMDRESLRSLQFERLKWQIRRCYDHSSFYRERFERHGVHPDDLRTLADIRRFPVVTKEELREEQRRHPPFGRYTLAPQSAWRELHPSSGTTGTPVNTIWSERDVASIANFTARTMWSFGVRPGDTVQNAFSYGLWVAGMSVHYAAARLGCFVIPIGATMTERQVSYLSTGGSTVLLATPSYALYIAERLRQQGVAPGDIPLRIGCFGGEPGMEVEATRRKIETGLGIDGYDYYGLAEIGPTMASECHAKTGLHWTEDHHLIEIVNPETMEPCHLGEVGIVVITHLTREATPMVRYWTNDYARSTDEPCRCGSTHVRSPGGILGRADDMIIYRGAKFYPIQVEKVVRSFAELGDEFRIELNTNRETGVSHCTIIVEHLQAAHARDESLAERVRRALREELLVTPSIEIRPWGTLERTTFKAQRIIDLR